MFSVKRYPLQKKSRTFSKKRKKSKGEGMITEITQPTSTGEITNWSKRPPTPPLPPISPSPNLRPSPLPDSPRRVVKTKTQLLFRTVRVPRRTYQHPSRDHNNSVTKKVEHLVHIIVHKIR